MKKDNTTKDNSNSTNNINIINDNQTLNLINKKKKINSCSNLSYSFINFINKTREENLSIDSSNKLNKNISNKKDKFIRKLLYSSKLINSMNRLR